MIARGIMRLVAAACIALASLGCASTVKRLDGTVSLGTGPAKNACEKRDWLVLGPTSYELMQPSRTSLTKTDGAGLYRVGARSPESIPGLSNQLEQDPMVVRKASEVKPYDRDWLIATILGGAGIAAIGVGGVLVATSFSEKEGTGAEGDRTDQEINGTQAAIGGVVLGSGFIMGILGVVISPNQQEAASADASRYVFNPSQDDPERVKALVDRHNARVRQRCDARGETALEIPPETEPGSNNSAPGEPTDTWGAPSRADSSAR